VAADPALYRLIRPQIPRGDNSPGPEGHCAVVTQKDTACSRIRIHYPPSKHPWHPSDRERANDLFAIASPLVKSVHIPIDHRIRYRASTRRANRDKMPIFGPELPPASSPFLICRTSPVAYVGLSQALQSTIVHLLDAFA
jgi:hypothetical protein